MTEHQMEQKQQYFCCNSWSKRQYSNAYNRIIDVLLFCYYTMWMWVMLLTFRRYMLYKTVSFCLCVGSSFIKWGEEGIGISSGQWTRKVVHQLF